MEGQPAVSTACVIMHSGLRVPGQLYLQVARSHVNYANTQKVNK